MPDRLYRSRNDRMVGGVCGGLGIYLGIDPTLVRLAFVILLFGNGIGSWLYVLLWILIPEEGDERTLSLDAKDVGERVRGMSEDIQKAVTQPHPQAGLIVGGALILFGVLILIENLNIPWLWWLDFDILWPILLIVAGLVLFLRYRTQE